MTWHDPQNSRDFSNWYGPSDYDVRHRLSTNFVLNLPFGHNAFGRDWVASGIYSVRSGRAFTVNQSTNNVGQSMTGLPDENGDPTIGVYDQYVIKGGKITPAGAQIDAQSLE